MRVRSRPLPKASERRPKSEQVQGPAVGAAGGAPAAHRGQMALTPELSALLAWISRAGRRYARVDAVYHVGRRGWMGAAAAVLLLGTARITPVPYDGALALTLMLGVPGALAGRQLLRRRPALATARRADWELGLRDRAATSVALAEVPPPGASATLLQLQTADAIAIVEAIDPARMIGLKRHRRGEKAFGWLGALAVAAMFLPNPQRVLLQQREMVREAAKEAARQVDSARPTASAADAAGSDANARMDATLSDLAAALAQNRGDAVAALAEIAAAEREMSREQDPSAVRRGAQATELGQRLGALANEHRQPGTKDAEASEGGADAAGGAGGLAELAAGLTAGEKEELAAALSQAAADAASELPEAAAELEALAEALESGDAAAVGAAAAALEETLAAAQAGADDAAAAERALAALQSARQSVSAAHAAGAAMAAGVGAPSAASALAQALGAAVAGQPGGGAQRQSGAPGQPGRQVAGRQSTGGQAAGAARQAGAPAREGGQGAQAAGQSPADGQGAGSAQSSRGAGGAGQAAGGSGNGQGGAGNAAIAGRSEGGGSGAGGGFGRSGEGNGAGGLAAPSGDGGYELTGAPQDATAGRSGAVYAPMQRLAPGAAEFIPGRLSGDPQGPQVMERESRNPGVSAAALVPYERVFGRYSDAAGEALEREVVPARWRDYVRLYFEQLEPQ